MPSISTHALHAESDDSATNFCIIAYISTHALHAESDFCRQNKFIWNTSFLPTLSMRRATNNMMLCYKAMTISTHALHAESDQMEPYNMLDLIISTHALHAESDLHRRCDTPCHSVISTHALHAESDRCASTGCARRTSYFYPRSPCGERLHYVFPRPFPQYFYPRSPCGERHYEFVLDDFLSMISTHALHAESDGSVANSSRLPTFISTHALHAESDNTGRNLPNGVHHFYPRSPCGERLQNKPIWNRCVGISTHALHAESDTQVSLALKQTTYFYPRSPCGERRALNT